VERAPQHRHARAVDARLLQLDLQPGPLEERVPGRGLAVVDRGRGLDGGARAPGQRLAGVEAGGGEVGQLVLVPGHPDRGGGQRVEGAVVVDGGVAEGVDGAFGHAGYPRPRLRRATIARWDISDRSSWPASWLPGPGSS